ncbi:hypothetical protein Kpol_1015p4 [Vanderwaltozyma polyspora DSM 70294]|uniref:Uncharacterized protein n=1 Tax=Vanderwaltozyma polyspora (strain ATCC 22028 / DSM 70294 / BCRC 21397 / CBS 2163 / NBRC 10782 / NRRL Y-8283 / UCD 57-17) TaxID=436907 RepID=A7TQN4_VANPO|nr:uncharacterized protein Kpol_1015p4 [Vanderwaltozyma polyspora DSM 70294]EDO15415.1 hypothetical protein Kpol_1015p4 [Vanderwaltozyma polyspora DSM 70294]
MKIAVDIPEFVVPGQLIAPEFILEDDENKESVYKFICGPGAMLVEHKVGSTTINAITASLLGKVKIEQDVKIEEHFQNDDNQEESKDKEMNGRQTKFVRISVIHNYKDVETKQVDNEFANNLPKEGDIVLAKVTRISLQRANLEILAVENQPVPIDSGVGSNGHGVVAAGGGSGSSKFSVAQTSSDFGEPFRGILRSQDVRATERDRVKLIENFKPGDIIRAQVLSLGDGTNYYLTTARNDLGVVFAKSDNGAGNLMYALDWQTMVAPNTGITEKRKCAKPFDVGNS